MVTCKMTLKREKRVLKNAKVVIEEIEKTLSDPVKPHYITAFKARTVGWKHKVQFYGKKIHTTNTRGMFMHAGGANENYWFWTSLGTKAHKIAAVRAPTLRFRLGYNAKTQPIDQYGVGDGKATGAWRSPKMVMHPGTKARKFEEGIEKDERKWFFATINSAIKRGIRAMQK